MLTDIQKARKNKKDKAWRLANKEKYANLLKAYYLANKEKLDAKSKAYDLANKEKVAAKDKAWRLANKDKIKAWRLVNKEKEAARKKVWSLNNKGKIEVIQAKRRALKINAEAKMTKAEKENYANLVIIRDNATKLFGYAWSIEHIIPLSKGGTNAIDNLEVTPLSWNKAKGNRSSESFWG